MDTEDIAVKANEIAPGRFAWRKYPEQINIEAVRKRLWDARTPEKRAYILGSDKEGWSLTEAGVMFARKHLDAVPGAKSRVSLRERTWLKSERERLLSTDAFLKFKRCDGAVIAKRDAESFFRIDNYIKGDASARESNLSRILNAFTEHTDLQYDFQRICGNHYSGANGVDHVLGCGSFTFRLKGVLKYAIRDDKQVCLTRDKFVGVADAPARCLGASSSRPQTGVR